MSQHPSLLGGQKGKGHRSVLKRYEKLKYLMEKDKWDEDSSIYNLPKIKSIKFKVKKEKAAPTEAEAAATPATATPTEVATTKPRAAQTPLVGPRPAVEKQAPPKDKKTKV